jgi:hypothetical protein
MADDDVLHASVSELVATFRQGLLALVPIAEKLRMNWRDDEQHHDWERLAEAVFDACVRSPISADARRVDDELPLARYDIDDSPYQERSWIAIDADDFTSPLVLVRLSSEHDPFDTLQCVRLSTANWKAVGRTALPFGEAGLVFVRRSRSGGSSIIRRIDAVE